MTLLALPAVSKRPLTRPDYVLLVVVSALLVISAVMVYSASFVVAHNEYHDDAYFLVRQVAWIGVGLIVMAFAYRFDYRRWRSLSLVLMSCSLLMLILVLVPGIGARSYGATRWIRLLPGVQLQPSELAKIAVAVYMADWLSRRRELVRDFQRGLLPFAVMVVVTAGLVAVQPDLGTTAILLGVAGCVFFVAGASLAHIAAILGGGSLLAVAFLSRLRGYQQDRITAFLDPWKDLQGSGWHTAQGLIAIGSGGIFGVGLGGSHSKFYWIPNAHTDAIFAIIAEELGFVGAIGLLVLFGVLAWRGFLIAWRAPDAFGRLLGTGLTSLLVLQALVNLMVVTDTIPYTGITLPLVSFGGTSTVVSLLAVGILLNISRHQVPWEDDLVPEMGPDAPSRPQPGHGRPFRPSAGLARGLRSRRPFRTEALDRRPSAPPAPTAQARPMSTWGSRRHPSQRARHRGWDAR